MILAFNATAYDPLPSGAKSRTVGLAAALLRAGHAVRLLAPRGLSLRPEVETEFGAPLPGSFEEIPTPLDPSSPLRRALASRRWFERNVPRGTDAFVTDYYPVIDRAPTLLTVHDLRYLAAPQFEPARRVAWFRAFYPRMARRAAGLVVPTRAVAAEAERFLRVPASRVAVVPNGLSRAWREAAPSAERSGRLLMIGFAERRKGFATVLAALREAPVAPPLDVAGRGRPPREAADLVAAGRVRFLGPLEDARLVDLCRRATALVHPSRYEGYGMTVIEAMALGTPVLAARQAAVEEVAAGYATLLPPGDVAAWAEALARLPDAPPEAREAVRSWTWDASAVTLAAAAGS